MQNRKIHRRTGRHRSDAPCQIARVADRVAVNRGDHITTLYASLGRRTVGLSLGYERTSRFL
jgi:hypothetical protein